LLCILFLACFPYFEKKMKAYEITLLSVYRFFPFFHDFLVLIFIGGFLLLSFFVSLFSPSSYSASYANSFSFVLYSFPPQCKSVGGLQIRNAWWLPHSCASYIGERASFIQQFAHPWCITNKHWPRTCVVEQQWHGALLECLHTIDCEVEPLTISLGTKKAPREAKLDCAQGRGPPDTESEGAMYCRYWYNARYVVSSALFPNPRVVSCSFPIGSTRKSKWTEKARYFKLDQKQTNKLHGLSLRANYTDRATAACCRSDCQLLRKEGPTLSTWRIPTAVFSVF
jgi:hypothetical protein